MPVLSAFVQYKSKQQSQEQAKDTQDLYVFILISYATSTLFFHVIGYVVSANQRMLRHLLFQQ